MIESYAQPVFYSNNQHNNIEECIYKDLQFFNWIY